MRVGLEKIGTDERRTYTATVERFGTRRNPFAHCAEKMILLLDVMCDGVKVTDHLWFKVGSRFEALNLREGDKVEFKARVGEYVKGYRDERTVDYHLKNPTAMRKIISEAAA